MTYSRFNRTRALLACVGLLWAASLLGPALGPTNPAPAPVPAPTLINGAGAAFPQPVDTKRFDEHHKLYIEFNSQGVSLRGEIEGGGAGLAKETPGGAPWVAGS